MLSILKIQNLTKKLKTQKEDVYLKNDLFVTAGEVAQDLGISKPFAYKLVRQMNEELETKGFITIAGRVRLWRRTKTNSGEHGMCPFTIMTGLVRIAGKLRGDLRPNGKQQSGNGISV